MAKIELLDMAFYAHHGCFEEERLIGTHFLVDVIMETATCPAAVTDALEDAVDYAVVYNIVAAQMAVPSRLLEHVAGRILNAIAQTVQVDQCTVRVSKLAPALPGQVGRSRVTLQLHP